MNDRGHLEIVQNGSGWVLRHRATALVEFPTARQALRAAVAVCQDEGVGLLRIRRADGSVQDVDPFILSLETFQA